MKYDYTRGQSPRYLVSIYGFDVEDKYYYHYYSHARILFNKLVWKYAGRGYAISISDLATDTRKDFFKG